MTERTDPEGPPSVFQLSSRFHSGMLHTLHASCTIYPEERERFEGRPKEKILMEGFMKNRKGVIVAIALITGVALILSCGSQAKYADVTKLMNEAVSANETFKKAMDSAADGKAVAAAITAYATTMKTLGPKIEGMDKTYPELEKNPPKELQELSVKFEKSSMEAIEALMAKASTFATDPDVAKALQAFEQAN